MAGYWPAAAANCSLRKACVPILCTWVGSASFGPNVDCSRRRFASACTCADESGAYKQAFESGCVTYGVIGFNKAKWTNVMPLA